MENTNTYMGLPNVLMHVIEGDIVLIHDIIFMCFIFKKGYCRVGHRSLVS